MTEPQNRFTQIIQELRNRRVFRVAAVYLAVAFAMLEAADIILPMLGLSQVYLLGILAILMIGFPIATTLSWHFQLTADGVKRSRKSGVKQTTDHKPLTSNAIIVILLIVITVLIAYPQMDGESEVGNVSPGDISKKFDPKSIAVLPFSNFSASAEDVYFADGIHDDILTQLSKIKDLHVISRTTMVKYRDSDKSMSQIADEVGVANVLEGSVRRAGDQVRIVAQLIKADTDEHLWAETYDREYADIFSIQSDVAKKIAGALKSALSPEEQARLDAIPTANMEAYDYFLRGNHFWYTKTTMEGNLKAIAMYDKALALDPNFGLAHARQSIAHSVLYQREVWDPTPERMELAQKALEEAIRLIPDHPEVHFAQGIFYDWCLDDNDSAIIEFEIAATGQPGSGEIANHLGQLYALSGDWLKAKIQFEKAYELEPDGIGNANWLAGYYYLTGDYELAENLYRKAIQNFPENTASYRFYSELYRYGYGDLERAGQILEEGVENSDVPGNLAIDRKNIAVESRDYETALRILNTDYTGKYLYYHRSTVYYLSGQESDFKSEHKLAMQHLEKRVNEQSDNAFLYGRLGVLNALVGNRSKAIEFGNKATNLEPVSENALFGPELQLQLAVTYSVLGDLDRAINMLSELLSYPSGTTVWRIKLNPFFDNLHNHPRFKELVNSQETS